MGLPAAVNEVITAYENGTIVTDDMYPPLPNGFSISKNRSLKDIDINPLEEDGRYLVNLASTDKNWLMVVLVDDFIFNAAILWSIIRTYVFYSL